MQIQLSEQEITAVLNELAKRPYYEVFDLMQLISVRVQESLEQDETSILVD